MTTITAVCGECEHEFAASQQPDFCGRCGRRGGPWVIVTMRTVIEGASIGMEPSARLVGPWTDEARERALIDLGDLVDEDDEGDFEA